MYESNIKDRFWGKVGIKEVDECWEWQATITNTGYGQFGLYGRLSLAHRVAWELTNGPISEGIKILHKCDNSLCCNPGHLYCGTQKDNMKDRGNRNAVSAHILGSGSTKLHEGEIWLIRKLWKEGKSFLTQGYIANMFKVSNQTISHIVNSTGWLCKEGKYV